MSVWNERRAEAHGRSTEVAAHFKDEERSASDASGAGSSWTPRVSVVLPVRNEEAHIRECLRYVLEQTYPADRTEILVVDGRSDDDTRAIARDVARAHPAREIRVLDNPQQIVPTALNIGIRAAAGDVIVRMDGHTVPEPNYIEQAVSALATSNALNAGGLIRPEGQSSFGRAVALAQSHPLGAGDAKFHFAVDAQYVDTVYLGAFRREAFERAGLFDESMVRNQDYEMNVRIRQAGGRVFLDPSIRSRYVPRGSVKSLWRQYFQYGWWRVETVKRHPQSLRWRQALPAIFVLLLSVGAVTAPFSAIVLTLLSLQLALYLGALGLSTIGIAKNSRLGRDIYLRFPVALAVMHIAFGSGVLVNVASLGRMPKPAGPPRVPDLEPKSRHSGP